MKVLVWIVGIAAGLFVLALIIGSNVSPERSRAWQAEKNAEVICEQMMSDAKLGAERRTTREVCEQLKAEMARRSKAAK